MASFAVTPEAPSIANLEQDIQRFDLRVRHDTTTFDDRVTAQACHLTKQLVDHLTKWRHQNNYPLWRQLPEDANNLDKLQSAFTKLFNCLEQCRMYMQTSNDLHRSMRSLLSKSWVIEENPCQINKLKDSKSSGEMEEPFKCRLRCLLPNYWRCKIMPKVAFTDVDDSREQSSIKMTGLQEIDPNKSPSVVVQGRITGAKPVKKTERKLYIVRLKFGDEAVVESLPIGFFTHTTQIPIVSGNVLWFNAFARVTDGCLVERGFPTDAQLSDILTVLNLEFHKAKSVMAKSMRSTKRGMDIQAADSQQQFTHYNYRCLSKMLNGESERDQIRSATVLKEKVDREGKFTFWEWFYACFKTKSEYVSTLYEKGLVIGFITKEDAADLLKKVYPNEAPGTKIMLLRYSMNYVDVHHAYLSPSILRTIDDPEHGRPIKASKYKNCEQNLGPVLVAEIGEPQNSMHVLTVEEKCRLFSEAFRDYMRETETFEEYRVLNRDVEGAESVTTDASDALSVRSPAPSEVSLGESLQPAPSAGYNVEDSMDFMDNLLRDGEPFMGIAIEVENGGGGGLGYGDPSMQPPHNDDDSNSESAFPMRFLNDLNGVIM